jgi:hypothetical protein
MGLTYGFYNSLDNDRKYNATHMSKIFDGIINDGVFMSVGQKLMVSESTGMYVKVGTGRAWFNSTWTYNDAVLLLAIDASEMLLPRIDTVVLEINAAEDVRANLVKVVKGVPHASPEPPVLLNEAQVHQYPLAHIYVAANVNEIAYANITNTVGTSICPFVTGILETMDIDALIAQWGSEWDIWTDEQTLEFNIWFDTVKDQLTEDAAGNIINNLLPLKANLESPNFTGTVGGITKTMVGLGNVDNTSDSNKPVSTAQQTALDDKVGKSASTGTTVNLIWSGTQAQYDAIGTKDANTLYFIV